MRPEVLVLALAAACAGQASTPDACVATLDVTGPDTFNCHDSFRATFSVANTTCPTLGVSSVAIQVTVLSSTGTCNAPAPMSYPPLVTAIGPGHVAIVQDITGPSFCCPGGACAEDYACDLKVDYRVVTSAGTLTQTIQPIHVELPNCDTICPAP